MKQLPEDKCLAEMRKFKTSKKPIKNNSTLGSSDQKKASWRRKHLSQSLKSDGGRCEGGRETSTEWSHQEG